VGDDLYSEKSDYRQSRVDQKCREPHNIHIPLLANLLLMTHIFSINPQSTVLFEKLICYIKINIDDTVVNLTEKC
jgi:hypothetical protein